ncbi:MAG: pyridoxamine 5'-phosphate oxidase family protein [Candidatus Hodarchaeota archaeon]
MKQEEIKQECLKLMESADVMYLGTISSNGSPNIRMMSNLRNKEQNPGLIDLFKKHSDDFLIYMVTSNSSVKMQQIRANSKASVYFCNPGEFHGLMLTGTVEEITEENFKEKLWQKGWEMYWPGGASDPEFTVLQILPDFAKGWYKEGSFEFKLK